MTDTGENSVDDDDVEGHVVVWDVPQLMQLPASGVAPVAAPAKEPRPSTAPAGERRRVRPLFGRGAPSPSAG